MQSKLSEEQKQESQKKDIFEEDTSQGSPEEQKIQEEFNRTGETTKPEPSKPTEQLTPEEVSAAQAFTVDAENAAVARAMRPERTPSGGVSDRRAIEAAEAFAAGEENRPLTDLEKAQAELLRAQAKSLRAEGFPPTKKIELTSTPQIGVTSPERAETPNQPVITGVGAPLLAPAVAGESEHPSINMLRMQEVQLIAANPFPAGLYGLSDDEKTALLPVASELVRIERAKKLISPDVNPREELEAVETPDGNHDAALWLDAMEDGMFGDTLKDALFEMDTHLPTTGDEAAHRAAIGNHPIVRALNEAGAVLVKENTQYGDAYEHFETSDALFEAHPEIDRGTIDTYYNVSTGQFDFPVKKVKDAGGQVLPKPAEHTGYDNDYDVLTGQDKPTGTVEKELENEFAHSIWGKKVNPLTGEEPSSAKKSTEKTVDQKIVQTQQNIAEMQKEQMLENLKRTEKFYRTRGKKRIDSVDVPIGNDAVSRAQKVAKEVA